MFDAALTARNKGDLPLAMELCTYTLSQVPESDTRLASMINCELGYIAYFVLERATEGEVFFGKAAKLSPRSELASMGLFHALVAQGKWHPALREAVRFLSLRDSHEYRDLFCDGYSDGMCATDRALVFRARELLAGYRSPSVDIVEPSPSHDSREHGADLGGVTDPDRG